MEVEVEVHALHDGSYELEVLTAALVVVLELVHAPLQVGSYELLELEEEVLVV